jgi:hypothetical protein
MQVNARIKLARLKCQPIQYLACWKSTAWLGRECRGLFEAKAPRPAVAIQEK